MQQRISFDPDPPVQGGTVKICYDFDGSGITETTLRVTFGPDGDATDYGVSDSDPCVKVSVPPDAEDITVQDLEGVSPTKAGPVSP